jgi:hypothetical protein
MGITFEFKEGDERLSSHSGLALAGALLGRTAIKDRASAVRLLGCKEPQISHGDILCSMVGLIFIGKPDYAAIEPFREDPFFVQSLRLEVCPSSSTLRQRLDVAAGQFDGIIKEESARLIANTAPKITAVGTTVGEMVPLDIDVSPFDNSKSHKEGVSRTYKGEDGFAPIFSYIGREGYLIDAELREGKQHCQKGTVEFLRESISYAKMITTGRVLVRMDSGNDSAENIKVCKGQGVQWIIKRNLRRESKQKWLKIAKEEGQVYYRGKGKTVWRGVTYREVGDFEEPLRIVFEVTERTITSKGQMLAFPEIEVDNYWSSLEVCSDEVIELYHSHGESEQYHSELKTDMDLERLPSGDFRTNSLILILGMLAYNLLRLCGQESLREDNGSLEKRPSYRGKASRRRLRTVMQDMIYMACRVTCGSRRWFLSFGRYCPWVEVWKALYRRFTEPLERGVQRIVPISQ